VVLTSKIANPKTPAYPTTTIRLNRAEAGIPEDAQRFQPVDVQGEPVAVTIDEERGSSEFLFSGGDSLRQAVCARAGNRRGSSG